MRQVAVAREAQGKKIGTALVEFSEHLAREHGFDKITMHARETAVAFYERLDYERCGERFDEVTIPHWEMRKKL
jgi:ribosomal protein S18 acetylase RimI-like enzyme